LGGEYFFAVGAASLELALLFGVFVRDALGDNESSLFGFTSAVQSSSKIEKNWRD
jgi:hypothetical protein